MSLFPLNLGGALVGSGGSQLGGLGSSMAGVGVMSVVEHLQIFNIHAQIASNVSSKFINMANALKWTNFEVCGFSSHLKCFIVLGLQLLQHHMK